MLCARAFRAARSVRVCAKQSKCRLSERRSEEWARESHWAIMWQLCCPVQIRHISLSFSLSLFYYDSYSTSSNFLPPSTSIGLLGEKWGLNLFCFFLSKLVVKICGTQIFSIRQIETETESETDESGRKREREKERGDHSILRFAKTERRKMKATNFLLLIRRRLQGWKKRSPICGRECLHLRKKNSSGGGGQLAFPFTEKDNKLSWVSLQLRFLFLLSCS